MLSLSPEQPESNTQDPWNKEVSKMLSYDHHDTLSDKWKMKIWYMVLLQHRQVQHPEL